jgi:cytidylate kinase
MSATGVARSDERLVIAVDGPAASGKGTIAKRLAAHFRLPHLDTGLLYRAVGWRSFQTGEAPAEVAARLGRDDLDDPALRSDEAGQQASKVGTIPEVRTNLLKFQREFSSQPSGAVLDGRDIGTVICPDAPVKLFVTASTEVRAERRYRELRAQGVDTIKPRVLAEMAERDRRDSERAAAPLRAAPDAWLLDTSDMDADAALAAALAFIERKGFRAAGP